MKGIKGTAKTRTSRKKRLVFDLETAQFSETFRHCFGEGKIHFAPKLRLGCVYDMSRKDYTFYEPKQAKKLIEDLLGADEIISFNGKNFDLLVLQRHHRLSKRAVIQLNKKHIDLCEEVECKVGYRLSLDKLSRMNLGEKKHTQGREMFSMNMEELRAACRSDVSQTHRLLVRHEEGTLCYPERQFRSGEGSKSDRPLIHSHLPDPFPYEYLDLDCEDLSEGELAEYLAGTWGILNDGRFTFVQV